MKGIPDTEIAGFWPSKYVVRYMVPHKPPRKNRRLSSQTVQGHAVLRQETRKFEQIPRSSRRLSYDTRVNNTFLEMGLR